MFSLVMRWELDPTNYTSTEIMIFYLEFYWSLLLFWLLSSLTPVTHLDYQILWQNKKLFRSTFETENYELKMLLSKTNNFRKSIWKLRMRQWYTWYVAGNHICGSQERQHEQLTFQGSSLRKIILFKYYLDKILYTTPFQIPWMTPLKNIQYTRKHRCDFTILCSTEPG